MEEQEDASVDYVPTWTTSFIHAVCQWCQTKKVVIQARDPDRTILVCHQCLSVFKRDTMQACLAFVPPRSTYDKELRWALVLRYAKTHSYAPTDEEMMSLFKYVGFEYKTKGAASNARRNLQALNYLGANDKITQEGLDWLENHDLLALPIQLEMRRLREFKERQPQVTQNVRLPE